MQMEGITIIEITQFVNASKTVHKMRGDKFNVFAAYLDALQGHNTFGMLDAIDCLFKINKAHIYEFYYSPTPLKEYFHQQ